MNISSEKAIWSIGTPIYTSFIPVYVVVTRKSIGRIKPGEQITNVRGFSRDHINSVLADWLANNNVKRSAVKVIKGYVPEGITNFVV